MKKILLILCSVILLSTAQVFGQDACKPENCTKKKCKKQCKVEKVSSKNSEANDLSCHVTSEEQLKRSEELRAVLFKDYEKFTELTDGVEFVYADSKKSAPQLIEFINIERECCPFYTFNLRFDPNSSKVSMTIGGSEKIKAVILSQLLNKTIE